MNARKILIIDSNKKQADSLALLLQEEGYQSCCANTGQEAINLMKKDIMNLIITDIYFKDTSGQRLILQLSKLTNKKPPIIILSEEDDSEAIEEFFRQGICDYIIRPPRLSYLLRRIEGILSRPG